MMAARGSQARALALITIVILLLVYSLSRNSTYLKSNPVNQPIAEHSTPLPADEMEYRTACDAIQFETFRDDRSIWDGQQYKSLFVARDGTFTLTELDLKTRDSVCVIVLLPQTPALSPHIASSSLSASDSILTYAISESIKYNIELQQHSRYTNVYYGPAFFPHPDVYHLMHTIEHRSYFWLEPSRHPYKPINFESSNRVHVTDSKQDIPKLPYCDPINTHKLNGRWIEKAKYQAMYPFDFYGMFDEVQEDHALHGHLFVPDWCRLEYTSIGQGARCLDKKIVHVWGDGHIRRNLKAIASADNWCEATGKAGCTCNDDEENMKSYTWAKEPLTPLALNQTWQVDTKFHMVHAGMISNTDWPARFAEWTGQLPQADVVVFSVGNEDIASMHVKPQEFKAALQSFATALRAAYPTQRIVIRTPRQFAGAVLQGTSWSAGRSQLFAQLVLDQFRSASNMVFWDVAKLGVADRSCLPASNQNYAHRQLVSIENLLFWNAVCHKA